MINRRVSPEWSSRRAFLTCLGAISVYGAAPFSLSHSGLFTRTALASRPAVSTMPRLSPEESNPTRLFEMITWVEAYYGIPKNLLTAMAFVESGRTTPSQPRSPWPWTLNIGGKGRFYETKASAQDSLLDNAQDVSLIDVGLLQINTKWHAQHFRSLSDMLDPSSNILYAGHYLATLAYQKGSWTKGVASYHASRPEARQRYLCVVLKEWLRRSGGRPDLLRYCQA